MGDSGHFLTIENATKVFPMQKGRDDIVVIDDMTMLIDEGEFIVFLGPSGCGKTTLMRVVGGLEQLTDGRVLLDGEEVKGPDRRKGMVFQSYTSFPWLNVLDNIRFGMRYRRDIDSGQKERLARHYLELMGLEAFADFYVNRISGGMRQRVAIARTLAAGPDILLMDEPFGALDAQTREFLQEQLRRICRAEKKTVIFVTHDVDEAIFLADRIFVFSARPARVLEEVNLAEIFPGERSFQTKEERTFFQLRNRILALIREQAQRAEKLMFDGREA